MPSGCSGWSRSRRPAHQDDYVWVVVRHEIDYLRAVLEGETITARTWAGEPKGAKFDRHIHCLLYTSPSPRD